MRVLVIGGGVGGLAAAVALRQHGVPVVVYESARAPGPAQAGLWLPPNAMQIFKRLELAQAVRAAGVTLKRGVVETTAGRVLHEVDLAEAAEWFGAPSVALSRGALQRVLAEPLAGRVLHRGMTCTGFTEGEGQLTARFTREHCARRIEVRGEVFIGADGAGSKVRQRLFPSATLRATGQVSHRGLAPVGLLPEQARTSREIWGNQARVGFVPVGKKQVYWFAVQPAARAPLPGAEPGAVKEALQRRYASFPAPVPALIGGTPAPAIARAPLEDLAPLKSWHRGRVALLGDAAHAATPHLGQGAAQAVEDAYVLAATLAAHDGTPEPAFSHYEDTRMRKAHRVVRRSRQLGQVAQVKRSWVQGLRDRLLRLAPAALRRRQLHRLYALDY